MSVERRFDPPGVGVNPIEGYGYARRLVSGCKLPDMISLSVFRGLLYGFNLNFPTSIPVLIPFILESMPPAVGGLIH